MGYSSWSSDRYRQFMDRATKGGSQDPFEYDRQMRRRSREEQGTHELMDPRRKLVRECCDSVLHPAALDIAILLDETGSMRNNPGILIRVLDNVLGMILRNGAVPDPAILIAAVGDEYSGEPSVIQIGEYESDEKIAEWLSRIHLVGSGGGTGQESYGLAMFHATNFVRTDAWDKRRKKGYYFVVGDEAPYPKVTREGVRTWLGNQAAEKMEGDLAVEEVARSLRERKHCFYIQPTSSDHSGDQRILSWWRSLFGNENVLQTEALQIPRLIAQTVVQTETMSEVQVEPPGQLSSRRIRRL